MSSSSATLALLVAANISTTDPLKDDKPWHYESEMNESRCWTEGLEAKSGVWNMASGANVDPEKKLFDQDKAPSQGLLTSSCQIKFHRYHVIIFGQNAILEFVDPNDLRGKR